MAHFNVVYGNVLGGRWATRYSEIIEAPSQEVAYIKAVYVAHKYHEHVLDIRPIQPVGSTP